MPFAVGAVFPRSTTMMQGQVDHGPVATAGPRAVPFPPAFSLSQSQHYGAPLRPLEPPPQGFAPLYPHSRPDGKRNRPRKSKNAQGRGRRSSKNAALKPGFDAMLKANRQQTKKHFQRKYTNCECCRHLKATYCLGPGSCADTESLCDTGLAETPRNLSHGAPVDVSHLAISEALKPGTCQLCSTITFAVIGFTSLLWRPTWKHSHESPVPEKDSMCSAFELRPDGTQTAHHLHSVASKCCH